MEKRRDHRSSPVPWRNPDIAHIVAPILAMVVAFFRVIYDRKETRPIRVMLEALICGLLTVAAWAAITAMGLPDGWSIFAGGVIGFMGSEFVRTTARTVISKRSGGGQK